MSKERRTPATRFPYGLETLFPDSDHVERCRQAWAAIEARPRRKTLDVARILTILRNAWVHAGLERDMQTKLNTWGAEFFDRDKRITALVAELRNELARLFDEKKIHRLLDLAVRRSHPIVHAPDGLTGTVLMVEKTTRGDGDSPSEPDTLTISGTYAPIFIAFEKFRAGLDAETKKLRAALRRPRGHQDQPWIAPAMRHLKAAGLTSDEADELLRSMDLKGSDTAEDARQTIPRR